MPSSYSTGLRIELIATGEQSGTWGATTNNNLGTLIEDAISGMTSVTTVTSPYTLTAINGAADESRAAALQLQTTTGANFIVVVPTVTKLYVVKNVDPTYSVTVKTASGNGVVIPAGQTVLVRCNGTDVVEQLNYIAGSFSFAGLVTGPTAAPGTNTTQLATTAFVTSAVGTLGTAASQDVGLNSGNVVQRDANNSMPVGSTWSVRESGGFLYFAVSGVNKARLDSSGNLVCVGNVTAYGSI